MNKKAIETNLAWSTCALPPRSHYEWHLRFVESFIERYDCSIAPIAILDYLHTIKDFSIDIQQSPA